VELSPNIVTAARNCFGHINGAVLNDPRVRLHVTDGRNWLQLTSQKYDLITIEISSIWFAGAENLYNREFYQACARQLRQDGVLQQWVQLHHMRTRDLLVIFNTMREVFPHMHFFATTYQGVLIASREQLVADYVAIEARNRAEAKPFRLEQAKLDNLFTLFGGLLLDDEAMSNVLTNLNGMPTVSRDLLPYLEYATPRGNFLPYDAWYRNIEWLRRHRTQSRPNLVNVPGLYEELVVQGCIAFGREDPQTAQEQFRQAQQLSPSAEVASLLRQVEHQLSRRNDQ
jgi:spermidine synthase